jgi:O-antigen/teichoic acid export membrane protein
MIKLPSLFKSTFIYTILGFIPIGVSFLLSPILTYYLSPSDFGIISISNLFNTYLTVFLCLGFDAAFSRFYFDFLKTPKILNEFYSTTLISILAFSGIAFIILQIFGDRILTLIFKNNSFRYFPLGILTLFTSIFSIFFIIIQQYYRNTENLKSFARTSLYNTILNIGFIVLGVVVYKLGSFGNIFGKFLAISIMVIPMLIIIFFKIGFIFKISSFIRLLKYGVPIAIYLFIGILFDNYDKIVVENNFSTSQFGIYNFAFIISSVINIFLAAFQSATYPSLYKNWESTNTIQIEGIKKTFNYLHELNCVVITLIIAFASPLMLYVINKSYIEALNYIPVMCLAFIPRTYFITYSTALFYNKNTITLPIINFLSFVVGVTTLKIFFFNYGLLGICYSIVFTKFVQLFFSIIAVKIMDPESFRNKFSFKKSHILNFCTILLILISIYFSSRFPTQEYFCSFLINFIPLLFVLTYIIYRHFSVILLFFEKVGAKKN